MKEILNELNPWWAGGNVPEKFLGTYKRHIYSKMLEEAEKNVSILIGPRQVGKTTILYQIINKLLLDKTMPRSILYLSFDEAELRREGGGSLRKILDYYKEYILGTGLDTGKIYIFLDEVQKLTDWNEQVKYWQDLKLNIKFYVSGSSALHITEGTGESLLGRIDIHKIYPLSLKEMTEIKGWETSDNLEETYRNYVVREDDAKKILKKYLFDGGYPDTLNEKSPYSLLSQYIDLTLKRDLLDLTEVRDSIVLNDLLVLLASQCSQRISLDKLASTLKISISVVSKYLDLLEAAFLIKRVYLFDINEFVTKRKERKIYFVDNGIRNTLLKHVEMQEQEGFLAENSVSIKLMEKASENPLFKFYFHQPEKSKETDFLILSDKRRELIEVKYQNTISESDTKNIMKHARQLNADRAYLITKNVFKKHEKMTILPLWLFLLAY